METKMRMRKKRRESLILIKVDLRKIIKKKKKFKCGKKSVKFKADERGEESAEKKNEEKAPLKVKKIDQRQLGIKLKNLLFKNKKPVRRNNSVEKRRKK